MKSPNKQSIPHLNAADPDIFGHSEGYLAKLKRDVDRASKKFWAKRGITQRTNNW